MLFLGENTWLFGNGCTDLNSEGCWPVCVAVRCIKTTPVDGMEEILDGGKRL
jgi:hypothetical protein